MRIKITTTVSQHDWEYCQKNGIRWADAVHMGIASHMKPEVLTQRLRDTEVIVDKLREKVNRMQTQRYGA